MVPWEGALTKEDTDSAYEIRLRCGKPMQATGPWGIRTGTFPLTPQHIHLAAQALCGHSLANHEAALRQGYVPLPGGHRMGVCGRQTSEGLVFFSSLCVRIAREIKTAAAAVHPLVHGKSVLIIGPPGSGKTTLLRDLIRRTALTMQVSVADTRGEIAACFQGAPQLDVGAFCDVMTGGEKGEMMMQLLRCMQPDMIATDELGSPADAWALMEMQRCGVGVIATAHAATLEEARQRAVLDELFQRRIFSHCLLLEKPEKAPRLVQL